MRRVLLSLLLVLLPGPALAGVAVLDSGTVNSTTATTATVAPPAGQLLLMMFGYHASGNLSGGAISGLGVSWTQVEDAGVFPMTLKLWRAIADGSSGAVTFTCSGCTPDNIAWQLLSVDGIVTTTNQGVVAHTSTNLYTGPGSPTCVQMNLGSYANPRNLAVTGWLFFAGSSPSSMVFTQDPDVGWTAGPTVERLVGTVRMALATQWLIVRDGDNISNCTWTWNGGAGSNQNAVQVELAAGPVVKHRVYQQ